MRTRPLLIIALTVLVAVGAYPLVHDAVPGLPAHDHGLPLMDPLSWDADALAEAQQEEDPYPERTNGDGQEGSGGNAVAHHAGGEPIEDGAIAAQAPDARVYRVGINGWEPSMGVDDEGRIFFQTRTPSLQPEVMRSTDEGNTWELVSPQIGGQPAQPLSLDPFLHLDSDTGRVFTNNLPPSVTCPPISFSDDGGETWTTSSVCGQTDHQSIFTGPPVDSTTSGYPNIVYYCAINGGALTGSSTATGCSKSLDGGLTFVPTGEPAYTTTLCGEGNSTYADGAAGHVFVDDQGNVYVPRGFCDQPLLSISHDEGMTWEQVQVADNGVSGHEANVTVDSAGTIYYTWVAADRMPYLVISTDGGETWGEPAMIAAPGVTSTSLPNIESGADGKIALVYMGTEAGEDIPVEEQTWNGYLAITHDALAEDPIFLSGPVNDLADPLWTGACGVVRCGSLGDFFDVVVAPDGTAWAAFVDACVAPDPCIETFEAVGVRGEAIAGRFVGGPSLRSPDPLVPDGPTVDDEVVRVAGESRVETAVGLSQAAFDSADVVVLARSDDFPDALAASGLANEVDAPVLLTPTSGLDPLVAEELERLGVAEAYLMGGTAALSSQVEADLQELGVTSTRIGGAERFETAALIAREVVERGGAVDRAVVALGSRPEDGDAWPDAIAAGNLAAEARAPVLLTLPDRLPAPSTAALDELLSDGDVVYIAGGDAAVGPGVEQEIADAGRMPQRLAGDDRYGTAVAVVEEAQAQGASLGSVVLASGEIFADALVAGPAAQRLGGVMVLVDPDDLEESAATADFLARNADAINTVFIAGGPDTISDRVADQVRDRISPDSDSG